MQEILPLRVAYRRPWSGKFVPVTVLSVVALFALSALIPSSGALADEKGWVLTQKSTTLGDQYIYISPSGLKCVNPKAGFALVTKAPDWNIVLFNDKTRVYFQTTLDKWRQDLQSRGMTSPLAGRQWSRAGNANIAGMKATQYVMRGGGAIARGKSKKPPVNIQAADYYVSEEISVPSKLTDLLTTAYGLPPTANVPLRLNCQESGKPQKTLLDTYRSQQAPIPISYFTCPGGYKAVKSDAEVMMTDEQRQMIEDMTKDMGDLK